MTSKKILLFIVCLVLSSVTMPGCQQSPTVRPTATVEATLRIDPISSPTPTSTNTPTLLPSPTATAIPPTTLAPPPTDEPALDQSSQSGIQGQVLMGPMCGGPISLDDPCPDQPFSATFHVLDSQGNQVARFDTDEQGYFQVFLAPGEYTIVPDKSAPLMSPANQKKSVTVPDQELVLVTLLFDTGIR